MNKVCYIDTESPEAILQEISRKDVRAFIAVYIDSEDNVTFAGQWSKSRVHCVGMLAEALVGLAVKEAKQ